MDIIIRSETAADIEAIAAVTEAAFANHPYSRRTEQFIIKALRAAKALAISLVAVAGGKVVGHIAFSPVAVADESAGWYGLDPISVLPELQRRGIGKSLMREGLAAIQALDAKGCMLVGDPEYYRRFGFKNVPDLILEGVPPQYFLVLPFGENKAQGKVKFHEGFEAKG